MTRALELGIGALVLAVGVAILVAFGTVPPALALIASDGLVLALGGLAIVAGVGTLYRAWTDGSATGTEVDAVAVATPLGSDREDSDDEGRDGWNDLGRLIAGRSWEGDRDYVDEPFRRALERPGVGVGRRTDADRSYYRREARSAVVETAVAVLSRRHDVDEAEAATMIREGRWTDDPRAAAFLEGSVRLPLRIRIVDWLYGRRYRRGLEAAVREIERLAAGGALERDGDDASRRETDPETALEDEPVAAATDYGTEAWREETDEPRTDAADATGASETGGSIDSEGSTGPESGVVSGSRPAEPAGNDHSDHGPPYRGSEGTGFRRGGPR